jgi:hypothetical protein
MSDISLNRRILIWVLPVHTLKLKESLTHHILSQHKIQDIKLIERCHENLIQVKYKNNAFWIIARLSTRMSTFSKVRNTIQTQLSEGFVDKLQGF